MQVYRKLSILSLRRLSRFQFGPTTSFILLHLTPEIPTKSGFQNQQIIYYAKYSTSFLSYALFPVLIYQESADLGVSNHVIGYAQSVFLQTEVL